MAEFTFDANNFLKVTTAGSGGGGSSVNIFDSSGNVLNSTAGSLNVNVTNTSPTAGTLSNNTAAPIADNVGVLPAVANAAPPTWTEGFQVLLSEDLSGNLRTITGSGSTTAVTGNVTVVQPTGTNLHVVIDSTSGTAAENLIQVAGVTLGATAVTAFGTAPAAANVPGVNSSIFAGTTGITATGTSLNVNVTSGSSITATVSGNKSNNSVAPGATNLGVLPGIANAATQTWTEGDQVLESMDLSGRQRIRGTLTANNAAPGSDGQMALTTVANAVAPTYTEGNLVLASVDLNGATRIVGTRTNNNAVPAFNVGVLPALANAANPSWTEGFQVLGSVDLSGRQRIMGQVPADTAFTGSPVVIAGVDTAGNVQELPVADSNTTTLVQVVQVGGAVTTAAPTYTTATSNPLSLDTAGNLRVSSTAIGILTNNNAAPAANEVGVLPALANAVSPLWTEGNQVLESVDLHGGQRTICGNIPEVTTTWTSATGSGTTLQINTLGYSTTTVSLNAVSALAGTITFEVSDTIAFTNAYPVVGVWTLTATVPGILDTYSVSLGTASGVNSSLVFNVAGWAAFRVRNTGTITGAGSITIGITATPATTTQPTASIRTTSIAGAIGDNTLSSTYLNDSASTGAPLNVADEVYGGKFSGTPDAARQGWSKMRTPTVFRTVAATAAGNTAIWTPGSGNKFRLLQLFIQVTDQASLAAGGTLTVDIQDGSTTTNITFSIFVPTTSVTTVIGDGAEISLNLGAFGILSAAANNVLNVNLSSALATGVCRIIAMGTEE